MVPWQLIANLLLVCWESIAWRLICGSLLEVCFIIILLLVRFGDRLGVRLGVHLGVHLGYKIHNAVANNVHMKIIIKMTSSPYTNIEHILVL